MLGVFSVCFCHCTLEIGAGLECNITSSECVAGGSCIESACVCMKDVTTLVGYLCGKNHTHTRTYTRTHACARARTHTHTHTHIYIYIYTHTHTHTRTYICTHTHTRTPHHTTPHLNRYHHHHHNHHRLFFVRLFVFRPSPIYTGLCFDIVL